MDIFKKKKRRFPKDFKKVVKHIKEVKGIDVILGGDTNYQGPFTREIIIHHNYDLRNNGLFVLLFECGKALIPFSNSNQFDKKTHPREYNYYQFDQDSEAWDMADIIIEILDLNIPYHEYYKFKYNHFLKYFSEKI